MIRNQGCATDCTEHFHPSRTQWSPAPLPSNCRWLDIIAGLVFSSSSCLKWVCPCHVWYPSTPWNKPSLFFFSFFFFPSPPVVVAAVRVSPCHSRQPSIISDASALEGDRSSTPSDINSPRHRTHSLCNVRAALPLCPLRSPPPTGVLAVSPVFASASHALSLCNSRSHMVERVHEWQRSPLRFLSSLCSSLHLSLSLFPLLPTVPRRSGGGEA